MKEREAALNVNWLLVAEFHKLLIYLDFYTGTIISGVHGEKDRKDAVSSSWVDEKASLILDGGIEIYCLESNST